MAEISQSRKQYLGEKMQFLCFYVLPGGAETLGITNPLGMQASLIRACPKPK